MLKVPKAGLPGAGGQKVAGRVDPAVQAVEVQGDRDAVGLVARAGT